MSNRSEIKRVFTVLTVIFWTEMALMLIGANFIGFMILEGSGLADAGLWILMVGIAALAVPTIIGLNKVEDIIRHLNKKEAAEERRAEAEHDAYVSSLEEKARFNRIISSQLT